MEREDGGGRVPQFIRVGPAGYFATARTKRMAEDLVRKMKVELTWRDEDLMKKWCPSVLPLRARVAVLGLMALLTESGLLPALHPSRPPADLTYVPVPLPGGRAQLADACGYKRTGEGQFGAKHERSSIRLVQAGVKALVETPRDLFHVWTERGVAHYVYAKAPIAQVLSKEIVEGLVESRRELYCSQHALYLGLHPYTLLGARHSYRDVPGDIVARCRAALAQMALEGEHDARLRRLVGQRPRLLESDLEFVLSCYMFGTQAERRISEANIMDQIGLGSLLAQRRTGEAERRLERAEELARRVGAIDGVNRAGRNRVYRIWEPGTQGESGAPPPAL